MFCAIFNFQTRSRLNEKFDDEQYEKIRKVHATTLVQTKSDKVYGLLGGDICQMVHLERQLEMKLFGIIV